MRRVGAWTVTVALLSAGICELTAIQRGNRLWDYTSEGMSVTITP